MSTAYPTPDSAGPHNPYAAPQQPPSGQPEPQTFQSAETTAGRKGGCTKWGGIGAGILAVLALMGSCLGGDADGPDGGPTTTAQTAEPTTEQATAPATAQTSKAPLETETAAPSENSPEQAAPSPRADEVPREYRNALRSAENYLEFSAFSYQGLYDQLTSEYADQFPADAAQYAVDNLQVDWNEQALKSAKQYLEFSPMSDAELYDQLVSEYGEQFTPEQAQYAIDHLDG